MVALNGALVDPLATLRTSNSRVRFSGLSMFVEAQYGPIIIHF